MTSLEREAQDAARDDYPFQSIRLQLQKERQAITPGSRTRTILRVLSKHGLLFLLRGNKMGQNDLSKTSDNARFRAFGRRLRLAFQELGPTFIKLGQVLVTRQELLPQEITEELSLLLDRVPPVPFEQIECILDEQLPNGIHTFEWIDRTPIGSASLGQVYAAKLRDGPMCAVKVIRPNVDQLFQSDITVIKKLVKRIQKRLPLALQASIQLPDLIHDYYSSSINELNMEHEAEAMNAQRQIVSAFETLHIPEVYRVTKQVLIQEYIDGWSLKEFPVDFFTFEERLLRMTDLAHYYIQTFLDGFYHGDPHGSNILVDRRTKKCVLIDFGMTGRMDAVHTEAIFRMLMHIRVNQADDATECAADVFEPTIHTDTIKFRDQMRSVMIHYVTSHQASTYNWGNLNLSLIQIAMKNYCKVPSGLALWAKGFSAAEGTARWLCPEISYHELVEIADVNILKSWTSRRFNYRTNASLLAETYKMAGTLPRRINKILERLAWNNMKLSIDTKLEDGSVRQINKIANRLSIAFLAGSLFIGGSILNAFGVNRSTSTLTPFFADVGLIGSGILSVYLVWRIIRSKRA